MKKTSLIALGLGCSALAVIFFLLLKIELVSAPGDAVSVNQVPAVPQATTTTETTTTIPTPLPPTPSTPTKPPTVPPQPTGKIKPTGSPFGHSQNYTIGSRAFYIDGLIVTLTNVTDSRCKPGVQCIWAGELNPLLSVTGGNFGNTVHEIQLGTITTTATSTTGYTFTLATTSDSLVSIIVSN